MAVWSKILKTWLRKKDQMRYDCSEKKTVVSHKGNPYIQLNCCGKESYKCFSTPKDLKCSKEDLDQADIKGNFLMVRILNDWGRLSMELVESPSCQLLKEQVDANKGRYKDKRLLFKCIRLSFILLWFKCKMRTVLLTNLKGAFQGPLMSIYKTLSAA